MEFTQPVSRRCQAIYNWITFAAICFLRTNWRERLADVEIGAEADETVHSKADEEVDAHARVNVGAMMAQRVRKMRRQGEVENHLAEENRDQVFEPSPWTCSEKLARHVD